MARGKIAIEALRHKDKRRNIPTAELEPVMDEKDKTPIRLAYERRNRDLDPQLVWRGKDEQDWSDLIVQAPPLYIQEKVHPKALIDDLLQQSKAWRDGIHSYLTYLRDRLTVARDLLADSGSIFVQIGDENVRRVRALMDEVFGSENLVSLITVQKAGSTFSQYLGGISDFVLWYTKDFGKLKYRALYASRSVSPEESGRFTIAQTDVGNRIPISDLGRPATTDELVAPDPLQSA